MIGKTNNWLKENWPVFLMFMGVGAGGTGAGIGIPYFSNVVDRLDVIIYIKCNNDQDCVDKAWKKVLSDRALKNAKQGN